MGFNDNQNKRINNFIVDELRLNPITDAIPKQVIPSIQPVFNVNQKICNIVRGGARTSSGGITVYTTPTDEDFYLVGACIGLAKDATNDVATGVSSITITIDGTAREIIRIPHMTLTASNQEAVISLPVPIKADRGTSITASSVTFTAGTMSYVASIIGYTQRTGDVTP